MLFALLSRHADRTPHATALVSGDRRITYRALAEMAAALADRLAGDGVAAGEAVAVVLPNSVELVVALFAAWRRGAIVLPLGPELDDAAIQRALAETGARRVITDRPGAPRAARLTGQDRTWVVDAHALALAEPVAPEPDGPDAGHAGRALYLYTSGSEGHRRRVCRTQHNLISEATQFTTSAALTADDAILCLVPLYHSYGLGNGLLAALAVGAPLVLLAPYAASAGDGEGVELPFVARCREVIAIVRAAAIRVVLGVGYQYATLAQLQTEAGDLAGVRWCFSSGSRLDMATYGRFLARFARPIRQIYGSTETGTIAANLIEGPDFAPDRVGRCVTGVAVAVLDAHGGEVADGEIGELVVTSPVVPPGGYDGDPEATARAFAGGRYRTGDRGRRCADGALQVVERKPTFIETAGYKVDPAEIEAVLAGHPQVREVAVIGVASAELGQQPIAFVAVDDGCDEAALAAYCAQRLAAHQRPAGFELRAALPRGPLGKILRDTLVRDRAANPAPGGAAPGSAAPGSAARADDRGARFAAELARCAGPRERRAAAEHWIRREVAEVLRLVPDQLAPHRPLQNLGFDSLSTVALHRRLEALTHHRLPITFIWDHPAIAALATAVLDQLGDAQLGDAGHRAPPAVDAGAPARGREPLAVIGIGCRFPGGVTSPETYWDLLWNGVDAISDVPADRWNPAELAPIVQPAVPPSRGGFLTGHDQLDAGFFGISPPEATAMDPQQRLLLEVTWEAIEDAGIAPEALRGSPTGVFTGIGVQDWSARTLFSSELAELGQYSASATAPSVAVGRVSYVLDLRGPSVAFDTACSSSLVALHYACQAVLAGECELALAGGVNVILEPNLSVALARAEMLAPDGRCKSFDAAANGYVRAEGCGVVVIKRLSAAVRDRDRIYAVIRGSAVTQDGRTHGLTAPSGRAQEQAIRAALAAAGVRPADVGYVEAHGTGTAIGDPIEAHALGAVLGEGRPADAPARIGSVKTNFGHTETAAGIAAFAKVALMLSRRAIPASLHFRTPNPRIDWDRLPLRVAATRQAWTVGEGERRIAGVTSAGFGGTNAHVVVEEPPEEPPALAQGGAASAARPAVILCLSARSEAALGELARRYERHLVTHPALALDDLAFTAAVGRGQFDHRAAIVIDAGDQARAQMIAALGALGRGARSAHVHRGQVRHGEVPRLAFVFTGQGAQRAGMGRALYAAEPVFRAALDECAAVFAADADGDAPALLDVMFDGGDALDATGWAQPALFALEAALIRLWASWGVTADVALGHSVGEFAAAHAGGALSLAAGLRLVAARGRLMQALPAGGTMIAVDADPEAAQAIVAGHGDRVALAAINGPRAVVLSGERAAVEAAAGALAARSGGRTRQLRVSHAFHSALLDPMLDELEAAARTAPPAALQATLISNVTGAPFAPGTAPDAAYWRRHARAPVQFAAGLAALAQLRVDAVIELGPRPVLLALAREVLGDDGPALIASLQDGRPEPREILTALAAVWARGARVDWAAFHANRGAHKIALPTYPFERKRYWIERSAPGMPGAAGRSLHPLLGRAVASAAAIAQFEAQLSASVPAYLDDHRIHGLPVLPAVGYVELALAAARQLRGDQAPIDLTDVVFDRALVLPEAGARRVQLVVGEREADRLTFEVHSQDAGGAASGMASGAAGGAAGGAWTCHARGTIAVRATRPTDAAGGDDLATLRGGFGAAVDLAGYYETLAASGLDYGPGFRGLGRAWRSPARPGELLAEVALPADHVREASEHLIHPALLDACLHGIRAAQHGLGGAGAGDDTYLPVGIAGITLVRAGIAAAICHIRTVSGPDAASPVFDVTVWDHDGQLAVVVRGLSLLKVERGALRRLASADVRTWLYEVAWDKAPLAAAEHAPAGAEPGASIVGAWIVGAWIVIDDAGGVARALARRFAQRGQRAVIVPAGGPDAIARAIVETAGPVHGVIHLGALALAGGGEPDPVRFLDDQRTLCSSALAAIHALVAHAAPPPALYLVTRGAQRVVRGDLTAPAHAALWGLGRVLATEHPELRTRLVDLDPALGPALDPAPGLALDPAPGLAPDPGAGAADAVAGLLLAEIDRGAGEPQIALRGGDRFAARLRPGDDAGGGARLAVPAAPCVALETRQPGILDELYLAPAERPRPGRGEIELEVIAAGVNFRDVMNALGTYPGGPEPFGGECAGRITAIGDGVTGLRIGDEVVAGLVRGAFRTFVIADVQFVARKPVWLSFAEIAAIPIGFLTAEYALRRLARLVRGERVLIHAGAGGVGTAAIQLALELGAEVFATAGSPSKRAFVRSLGVRHVMDSRSLAFADQIRDATGGEGVDVVLSSLAGEFVTRSLGLVRRGGRFVEIGKIHVLDPTADPSAVPPGIAYFHFDLGEECARQPGLWQDMFGRVLGSLEAGRIRLPPVQRFEIAEAPAAFRAMAQGHHLGKLVLDLARPGAPRALALDPHGAYLVTGGLGGLGLRVARWLVERGAGRVAVLGRQPPSDAARRALAAIDPDATRVIVLAGDVARAADVEAAVRAIERTLPLRGVFHAAGVLADRTLAHQTWDDFAPVLAGKALGALHLHRATRAHRLDCFVLFSSLTSILGAAGQANYAAANAVLDSLAHHRRALGLPALVVNWGAFRDVGMAAADPARRLAPLAQLGIDAMSADEGIAALEAVIATRATQVGVVPVDWATYATRLGDRASPLVAALAQARRRGAGRTAAPAARVVSADQIAGVVAAEIRYVLNLGDDDPIAGDVPLAQLGLDSLIAVELRNRLGRLVHASLPPTLLFDYPTFDRLAGFLRGVVGAPAAPPVVAPVVASVVAPMVAPAPTAAPAAAADRITEILSAIAALSEDEQQRLVETLFAKEP